MRRKLTILGTVVVVLGGAGSGAVLAWGSGADDQAATAALPPATANVERTTLVDTTTVSGTLGYGDPVPLSATGGGTLTWIAPAGSTVQRGQPLFRVDERPVVALEGSVPMYRALSVGVSAGADVQQLELNLAEMGYGGFTADDTFTVATATAVRAWQADLGVPQTGVVGLGQAVFTPGPVRIAEQTARVGDVLGSASPERAEGASPQRAEGASPERSGGGAAVLSYTGTTRQVTVNLPVDNLALAATGRTVTVTVPGLDPVEGQISQIGTVVTAPEEPDAPGAPSAATADASIEVTVTITDQAALGSLNAAPVDIDFVSEERQDVLAVPVTALLALAEGGYGVQIVDGATTRIVPVQTGMFASGRVEVSGDGIAEGVTVGVPE